MGDGVRAQDSAYRSGRDDGEECTSGERDRVRGGSGYRGTRTSGLEITLSDFWDMIRDERDSILGKPETGQENGFQKHALLPP